jgi:hypothetical protein
MKYVGFVLTLLLSVNSTWANTFRDSWLETALPPIFNVDKSRISLGWPIDMQLAEQYSGFASLRIGPGDESEGSRFDYSSHNAIDLVSLEGGNMPVSAPVSGYLFVLFDFDLDTNELDYFKDVWLFDSESHAIVRMSHVKPASRVLHPRVLYPVVKGEHVGTVAEVPQSLAGVVKPHVHLELIEYGKEELDPSIYIDGFRDVREPVIEDLIVSRDKSLIMGVSDRTNHGEYNGPPIEIDIEINVGGEQVAFARECKIQQGIAKLEYNGAAPFLDIDRMAAEAIEAPSGGYINTELNPNHKYWIKISGLSPSVCDQIQGILTFSEFSSSLAVVTMTAKDAFGNTARRTISVRL